MGGNGATNGAKEDCNLEQEVPHLGGVTEGDVKVAIKVLNAVAGLNNRKRKTEGDGQDGLEIYRKTNLRPFRKALAGCLELHKRVMFNGKSEEAHYEQRKAERTLKRQKISEATLQKKYIASTALRKGRNERLQKLKEEAKEEEQQRIMAMMVPDGHVDTTDPTRKPLLLENDPAAAEKEEGGGGEEKEPAKVRLPKLRSCYVCKVKFRDMHHFYDQLCPVCAPLNWTKRHQTADLTGRVAVVTGSRVKIGYQTCLKLLRAGATVVATTRFPNSAAATYQQEADFGEWKDRLQVYGLDLRDVTGLEAFTRFLKIKFAKGIDILINNACQTVRRPRGYYVPMMEKEQSIWNQADGVHKSLLTGCAEFENLRRQLHYSQRRIEGSGENKGILRLQMEEDEKPSSSSSSSSTTTTATRATEEAGQIVVKKDGARSAKAPFESTGISHSAAMSQMIILPEDVGVSDDVLPPGVSDVNGQQLDLRKTNSWLLKMEEVSTPELMECMFVNAIAPFVLNSRLKPLMSSSSSINGDHNRPDRYIINVSAMEGKFYRYKMPNHPHTNMAKAALNMMTRTSAEDLATKHRIFMNSVDTGWINDENPLERASKTAQTNLFQTPIDEIDAAARILDPIFVGVNGGRDTPKEFGKFLKDYKETEW